MHLFEAVEFLLVIFVFLMHLLLKVGNLILLVLDHFLELGNLVFKVPYLAAVFSTKLTWRWV